MLQAQKVGGRLRQTHPSYMVDSSPSRNASEVTMRSESNIDQNSAMQRTIG